MTESKPRSFTAADFAVGFEGMDAADELHFASLDAAERNSEYYGVKDDDCSASVLRRFPVLRKYKYAR